jgi:very-long-chain enoyl-CoA reductase
MPPKAATKLQVTNRCMQASPEPPRAHLNSASAAKKPIKKLPTSIEITDTTTVQDVKESLAKQAGGMDPNRLGLFDSKNKILKDRLAVVKQNKELIAGKEIFVKDLGRYSVQVHPMQN